MHEIAWEALGTHFKVTVWDDRSLAEITEIMRETKVLVSEFDHNYSRFKPDSLVSNLRTITGIVEVPEDLVHMLSLYMSLGEATDGSITPTIGAALEDIGYDAHYSLRARKSIADVPRLHEAIAIIDATHIELRTPILLDLGALGKGYLVDRIHDLLLTHGLHRFLVDGSGDIRYHDADMRPIICALEHPLEATSAIGTLSITEGSLCASGINRRAWKGYNHYLNPQTKASPQHILATWVYASTAAMADGLSSALFFTDPESLRTHFTFEYLILDTTMHVKSSTGFTAELFTQN